MLRGAIRLTVAGARRAAVASCGRPGNEGSRYEVLSPEEGWCYSDTLSFPITHTDTLASGRVAVGVTHTGEYPFSDLWLEITSAGKEGTARRDTLCLRLADRNGRWKGHGIGTSFQVADTARTVFRHRSGAPFTVRHIMREDTLRSVERVGLFFIPTK